MTVDSIGAYTVHIKNIGPVVDSIFSQLQIDGQFPLVKQSEATGNYISLEDVTSIG